MAGDLASLRPLVVAGKFDSDVTGVTIRHISVRLAPYVGLEQKLRSCPATTELAPRVEPLRSSAEVALEKSRSASIRNGQVQRDAGVGLFGLLPEVLLLSDAVGAIADGLGIESQGAQITDNSAQPIGSLAPLPTPTKPPTPKPTPKPTPSPGIVAIEKSFFGSGVGVSTYKVADPRQAT